MARNQPKPLRRTLQPPNPVLGGSGVVISRVLSRVTLLITHIKGLISLLITTPEPAPQSPGKNQQMPSGLDENRV